MKRPFPASSAALWLAACAPPTSEGYEPPFDANLLIVSIDTVRADHLSCYGYSERTTPTIDRLAEDGHLFLSAQTPLPSTLPAHAALFTSLYPAQLGVWRNRQTVPTEAETLAEVLRREGFRTAAFISSAPLSDEFGIDQGFDLYDLPPAGGSRSDRTSGRAAEWLEENGDERFFCFLHLIDPHTWYDAPDGDGKPWPPDRGYLSDPSVMTPEARRASVRAYDDELRFADRGLAAVIDALERTGLKEETIVLVTSDHGETLEELLDEIPYAFGHGDYLYEHQLNVPLILWLPPGFPGRSPARHAQVVTLLDVMPTALELLGLGVPDGLEGRSLAGLVRGGVAEPVPAIAAIRPRSPFSAPSYSVRTERWRWIHTPGSGDALFDLAGDPRQERDVAPAHPAIIDELRPLLETWRGRAEHPRWNTPQNALSLELEREIQALGYAAE